MLLMLAQWWGSTVMHGSNVPAIEEKPMSHRRIVHFVISGAIGVAGLGSVAAIPVAAASAATGSVTVDAKCSGSSVGNLQVQREDTGKLSVDFGVDMARHTAGVSWKVTESDNGSVFVTSVARTISDGSFSITRLIAPKPGTNAVVAKAVNPLTGETCKISTPF